MKIQKLSKTERNAIEAKRQGKKLLSKIERKIRDAKILSEKTEIKIPEQIFQYEYTNNRPRIAFCLFGIVGGREGKGGLGGDIDYIRCWQNYNDIIFKNNNVDVFIHTWSVQYEKSLRKIYSPKASIFEPQIFFHPPKTNNEQHNTDRFRSCSRWYSTMKVLELQRNYSETHNIEYDFIMTARFDVLWFTKIPFSTLEKDCFYVANWNLHKSSGRTGNASFPYGKMKRYSDMWFIGNQEQMNHLSGIYNVIHQIGNGDYDPHKLTFDRMFPLYKDKIRFMFLNDIDFCLIRKYGKPDAK